MKKFIIIFLALGLFLLGLSTILKIISPFDDFSPVFAPPFEHKPHKHEHEGLACCPCGGCHKHDDDEEELPEEITIG